MPEKRAAWVCDPLTQQLDLDASQQQELKTMDQELMKKGSSLHDLRATSRKEVLSILRADSVDSQGIDCLVDHYREQISDLVTTAGSLLTEFLNMLTPEQRQRLAKLIEDHAGCGCLY